MTEKSEMTENLNKKTNSKEIAIIPSKAIRAIRRGDYTRPVSFITEAEVFLKAVKNYLHQKTMSAH